MLLTPQQKKFESVLAQEELGRAIYLDFEGFENAPPTLVGYCCEGQFVQLIFDPVLESAALAKGLSVVDGRTCITGLVNCAIKECRGIVAYSQFDKNNAFEHFGV